MPVRFHLDENVSGAIARGLRARGIDVTVPRDVNLIGASDLEHLKHCMNERRVIVTHDDDYLRLHSDGVLHAGIAYSISGRRTVGEIVQMLVLISKTLEPDEIAGRVEFL